MDGFDETDEPTGDKEEPPINMDIDEPSEDQYEPPNKKIIIDNHSDLVRIFSILAYIV